MKIEPDGFKIPEDKDQIEPDIFYAIFDNLILLRGRIEKLEGEKHERETGHEEDGPAQAGTGDC